MHCSGEHADGRAHHAGADGTRPASSGASHRTDIANTPATQSWATKPTHTAGSLSALEIPWPASTRSPASSTVNAATCIAASTPTDSRRVRLRRSQSTARSSAPTPHKAAATANDLK